MLTIKDLSVRIENYKPPKFNLNYFLNQKLGSSVVESTSICKNTVFYAKTLTHPLVDAADMAFNWHLPIQIKPDDFWMCILQGFAQHITQNAEKYQHVFVEHSGQLTLFVDRDSFVKGNPNNDWDGVFSEFSDLIGKHIGQKRNLLVPKFSTSTELTTSCFNVGLMDAMSSYFRYEVRTMCGIPEFRIHGTKEDWQLLTNKFIEICHLFNDTVIDNWKKQLGQILTEIVLSFDNKNNLAFWRNFYHENSESGSLLVTGWIQYLFPYITNWKKEVKVNTFKGGMCGNSGTDIGSFPSGISSVPFIWKYYDQMLKMRFLAGHIGVIMEDGFLIPTMGWIVKNE